jgi:hypothetical protein
MGKIKIIKAEYGKNDTWIDVKDKFKNYYKENKKKDVIKIKGSIFNELFTDPLYGVEKDLKIKYKIKETDEIVKVVLEEKKDHIFPNEDSDSESESESESEKSESYEEEEEKLPKWNKKSKLFTVDNIQFKSKNIVIHKNDGYETMVTKKKTYKFSIKYLSFIQYGSFGFASETILNQGKMNQYNMCGYVSIN